MVGKAIMKRIVITQAVIDQCIAARKGWYNPCPLTTVLRQRFPRAMVLANGTGIHAGKHFRTPPEIASFITDWDKQRTVQPVSFWLFQKNRPWKRLAIWFNKLPLVISAKNKVWYPLKGLTRNIWPVRMYRVIRKRFGKEPKAKMTKFEQMKLQAELDSQVHLKLKLTQAPTV